MIRVKSCWQCDENGHIGVTYFVSRSDNSWRGIKRARMLPREAGLARVMRGLSVTNLGPS